MEKKLLEKNYIFRVRKMNNKLFLMTTKDCYEINEITKDIFEVLDKKTSMEDLILELEKLYENLNKKEIVDFIKSLLEKGIVKEC